MVTSRDKESGIKNWGKYVVTVRMLLHCSHALRIHTCKAESFNSLFFFLKFIAYVIYMYINLSAQIYTLYIENAPYTLNFVSEHP